MRIGFDAAPLAGDHSPGIARVVACALNALEARTDIEVVRLIPERGQSLPAWRQRYLPKEVARLGLAGLHHFQAAFTLRGPGKRVQTVHELSWKHGAQEEGRMRKRVWVRLGKLRASGIATATRFTAADLSIPLFQDGGKLGITPWAASPMASCAGDSQDGEVLARFGLGGVPFVLAPGAFPAKKQVHLAWEAIAKLRAKTQANLALVITDPAATSPLPDWCQAAPGLHALRGLTDPELGTLYRSALGTAVVSLSEGFSLPVVESLASGRPVLVTRNSAQSEVAGQAGLPVDPRAPESLTAGIERLVSGDHATPDKCLARAADFSWDRTAESIVSLWKAIL